MFDKSHKIYSDNASIRNLPTLRRGETNEAFAQVQNFLQRFGYLSPDEEFEKARLDDPTGRAIRLYQQFFGLAETGDLDDNTRELMSVPRCGMPDYPLTAFSTIGPWTRRNISYRFGTLTGDVTNNVARGAILRAFNSWQGSGVGLTFSQVASNEDIEVEWRPASDPDHDMRGGILAHADFPPGFSINTTGLPLPLHFDDSEHTWVDGSVVGGIDIETISVHEIGHCLGLLHTGVDGSVMFPSVSPNSTNRNIQTDDLAAIRSLYPPNGSLHTAASWGTGRYDVFGLSANGDVLQLWWNGRWNRSNLGNGFGSDRFVGQLAAASWGPNRLDVFGLGQTGNVLQLWWDGQWHWNDLGNGFAGTRFLGPISATSWGPGRYDVFGYDENGNILQLWWDGSWHWNNLGNGWGVRDLQIGQVAAASWGSNRIDLFSLRRNGEVLQLWWNGRWNWSNLGNSFSGNRFAGPLTAASWGSDRLDVFGFAPNGDVLQLWWNGGWNWSNLGSQFTGDRFVGLLAATSWGRNRLDVYGLGESGNVLQMWWNGQRWNWNHLGSMQ